MDWLKFYCLKGEPFGPQPLRWPDEFQNVFVLTEIIKTEVDPIISTITDSERYLYLISGERGAGKSTLMHYIINEIDKVGNILPVDVSLNKKSYKGDDPGYALQVDLTYAIAKKTIDKIMNKYEILSKSNYKLFEEYRRRLTSVGSNLDVPGDILQKIFSLLSQEKIVPIIFIDNLDKIDQKEALHFLKLPYAQSLFENFFFRNRVRIFLVADQSWLKELVHPDFSYLGRPIIIKPLNFAETQNLIQKKMRKKASNLDDFKIPFNEESIIYITKIADGNPRKIQDKCTTALIEGAQHNIKIIDQKFLQQIQNDLGKEFESIKDLLIQYPEMERNLAWLLGVRGKFKDTKSFEEALFNTLNLQKGNKLENATIDHLRNCELISFSLEKLDEEPTYRINPLFENLIDKIKIKMSIDVFIKWFSRTEAEVISISPAKSSILEELEIVCDSLPEPKKGKAREALKNYDLFRQCRLEDDDRNECVVIAHNVAKDLIGIIAPEILTIDDFTRLREVLKSKISKEVISDFFILNSYFSGNNNLNLSFSDIAVISEKLNNIIENVIDPLDKIIIKRVPFFFADTISFGNFMKKRLLSPGLLFLSPEKEKEDLFEQFCICWVSESPIYGLTIYGLSSVSSAKNKSDYFDDALNFYSTNYQYIPYPIQGLLRANGIPPAELEGKSRKIRIAHFYELSLILNRIIAKYSQIKMIFVGYGNLSLWTASISGTDQKIQMMEEGVIEKMPPLAWHSKYSNEYNSSNTTITIKTKKFSDEQINEIHENMPLLNYFGNTIKTKPFLNKRFFVVLHFLKDLIPFMDGCEKLGLKPSNTICFYKKYKYPNREEVSAYLEYKGYQIYPLELLDDFLSSYDNKEIDDEILIIEDGGYIAPALHKKILTFRKNIIGCVEQTTKGIREDKNIKNLRFPIISLPSFKLKQEYEPPFVADAVINNIHNLLPDINFKGQNALVIGGGTIGKEIASKLKSEMNVTVFDSNPNVLVGILSKINIVKSLPEGVKNKKLIIGATGQTSIGRSELLSMEHNTYLVSASSDQKEIGLDELEALNSKKEEILINNKKIGTVYQLRATRKQINLIADGYPINFWSTESMPNQVSDLILTLIFLSAIEICENHDKMSSNIQEEKVNEIPEKYGVSSLYLDFYHS